MRSRLLHTSPPSVLAHSLDTTILLAACGQLPSQRSLLHLPAGPQAKGQLDSIMPCSLPTEATLSHIASTPFANEWICSPMFPSDVAARLAENLTRTRTSRIMSQNKRFSLYKLIIMGIY